MFANVAGGMETPAAPPPDVAPEPDPAEPEEPVLLLGAVETTSNGAENRWGWEKSF